MGNAAHVRSRCTEQQKYSLMDVALVIELEFQMKLFKQQERDRLEKRDAELAQRIWEEEHNCLQQQQDGGRGGGDEATSSRHHLVYNFNRMDENPSIFQSNHFNHSIFNKPHQ